MADRVEHYRIAEALLEDGVETVVRIRMAKRSPDADWPEGAAGKARYMDGLGKKVMGIWAQAQVHATLASGNNDPPRLTAVRIEAREAGIQHDGDRP